MRQALEAEEIVLHPAEHGRGVVAHFGLMPAGSATGTLSEIMVAGAGFLISERVMDVTPKDRRRA